MTPLIQQLLIVGLSVLFGLVLGWRMGRHRRKRVIHKLQQESGRTALELLETRQHLKKISSHLQSNLKQNKTIKRLRERQKSSAAALKEQRARFEQKEKEYFIQTAKMKLLLASASGSRQSPAAEVNLIESSTRPPKNPRVRQQATTSNTASQQLNGLHDSTHKQINRTDSLRLTPVSATNTSD